MSRPYAAALSVHPLPTHAVGEVVGEVLDALQAEPDVAVLFVGAPSVGATEDIAAAVRSLLRPAVLVGVTAAGVLGGAQEVEGGPALALWAARTGPVTPFRATGGVDPDAPPVVGGLPPGPPGRTALVLVDPFSLDADALVRAADAAGLTVVGGLASAATAPGGNRLVLQDEVRTDGAVGFVLPAGLSATTVVSQGCRPVGAPLTVTAAVGNVLLELGGRPAAARLAEVFERAGPEERAALSGGVQVGRVVDERRVDFGPGDFLVRSVLAIDRRSGGVLVGDEVEIGATVQFQVRDADAATAELDALLADRTAEAALLFTCTGRGERLFGHPHHDAARVHHGTGSTATAGMTCAGELGPVGGRNAVHAFTASALLLGGSAPPSGGDRPWGRG